MFLLSVTLLVLLHDCQGQVDNSSFTLTVNEPAVFKIAANTSVDLRVKTSPNETAFWVFECHSQLLSLSLTLQDLHFSPKEEALQFDSAAHSGLVVANDGVNKTVRLINVHGKEVSVLLLVRAYTALAPIPGVCNKTNATAISYKPGLHLEWDAHLVKLNFSNAGMLSTPAFSCDKHDMFQYFVYQRFLDHRNFGEDYFLTELAETMLLQDDIEEYGTLVSTGFVQKPDREGIRKVVFSAYPGAASIFSVIVKNGNNQSSVYVSAGTYACHLDKSKPLNCEVMWFALTKLLCGFALFVGLFIAFLGHRFFSLTQFIFAFTFGSIFGYIVVENAAALGYSETVGLTVVIGAIFGLFWLGSWLILGIPIVAVALPTLVLGLLLACLVFFLPALNVVTFVSDKNYWLTLLAVTLAVPVLLVSFAKQASVLSCVVVGTYAVIVPIDHYTGASMKYILVNLLRRATVPDFNWAVLCVPFQTMDIALTVSWVGLTLVALLFQHVREQNRAPFPPNTCRMWRWREREQQQNVQNETVPLLSEDRERRHLSSAVMEEIRLAAREAALEATRVATESSSSSHIGSASSSRRREHNIPLLSDEELIFRRNVHRDPFRPPTPTADPVYIKL